MFELSKEIMGMYKWERANRKKSIFVALNWKNGEEGKVRSLSVRLLSVG